MAHFRFALRQTHQAESVSLPCDGDPRPECRDLALLRHSFGILGAESARHLRASMRRHGQFLGTSAAHGDGGSPDATRASPGPHDGEAAAPHRGQCVQSAWSGVWHVVHARGGAAERGGEAAGSVEAVGSGGFIDAFLNSLSDSPSPRASSGSFFAPKRRIPIASAIRRSWLPSMPPPLPRRPRRPRSSSDACMIAHGLGTPRIGDSLVGRTG